MDIEVAEKINGEVTTWRMRGLVDGPPPEPPPDYSLGDMVMAAEMCSGKAMTCDPRALAAIYTLANYEATPIDEVLPIVCGNGKALLLVDLKDLQVVAEEDECDDVTMEGLE